MKRKYVSILLIGIILAIPISYVLGQPKDTLVVEKNPWILYSDNDDELTYVIHNYGTTFNIITNFLTVIDQKTNDVVRKIEIDEDSRFVTIDSLRNIAYGVNITTNSVFWYDIENENYGYVTYENQTKVTGIPFFNDDNMLIFGNKKNQDKANFQILGINETNYKIDEKFPIPNTIRYTGSGFKLNNFFSVDSQNNELIVYEMKSFEPIKTITLSDYNFEEIRGIYLTKNKDMIVLDYRSFLEIFDISENKIIASIEIDPSISRMIVINNDKLYTIDPDYSLFQTKYGKFLAFDLNSGTKEFEIKINIIPGSMAYNNNLGKFYISNSYSNSISVIDEKTQNLILTPASHRFELGVGAFISTLFFILYAAGIMSVSRRIFVGSIVTVVSLLIIWIFDFTVYRYEGIYGWALILGSTYSASFLSFLIIKYSIVRKGFYKIIYESLKDELDHLIIPNTRTSLDVAKYILLIGVIALPSIYFMASSPLTLFLNVAPIPTFTWLEFLQDESESVLEAAYEFGFYIPILLGLIFGPLWGFILRIVRLEEAANNVNKKRGSRSLLLYLYVTYAFLIIQGVYGYTFVEVDSSAFSGIHGKELLDKLSVFVFLSAVLGIFIYVIQRMILPKYSIYSEKITRKEPKFFPSREDFEKLIQLKKRIIKELGFKS